MHALMMMWLSIYVKIHPDILGMETNDTLIWLNKKGLIKEIYFINT